MAYIDSEMHNARLIWTTISDRVLIIALIIMAMAVASLISTFFGHVPYTI
ncbi:MAG: hypothetical protein ACK4NW_00200 [Roseinatronobacter sp.]